MDLLYSLKTSHAVGDHSRTLKEGSVLLNGQELSDKEREKVMTYMWLAGAQLGTANPLSSYQVPGQLKEAFGLLVVVKLKSKTDANFFDGQKAMVEKAKTFLGDDSSTHVKYIAGLVLLECKQYELAFEAVKHEDDMDCQLLIVKIFSRIGRRDAAQVRLEDLKRNNPIDDVRVEVAGAESIDLWSEDEKKVKDALYAAQELSQVNGLTDKLALIQAIALERLGKFEEAERILFSLADYEKNANILANLIFISTLKGDQESANSQKASLGQVFPAHPLLLRVSQANAVFAEEF